MVGEATGRAPQPRLRIRAKLRAKAQLTLPEGIRRALHLAEGDEVVFAVGDDGTSTVLGYVAIPADRVWLSSSTATAQVGG